MLLRTGDAAQFRPVRRLVLWMIPLCLAFTTRAQEREVEGYQIIAHRASVYLTPEANSISCVDTISIRLPSTTPTQITLNLFRPFEIKKVTMNGRNASFKRSRDAISIEGIPSAHEVDIVLWYATRTPFRTETTAMTNERAILREEEILPQGQRALEFVRLNLVVPKGWETVTVGRLVARDSTETSSIFTWESDVPLPMIGAICAGRYWTLEDKASGVSVHLFQEDSSAATRVLAQAKDVLRFYNQRFTPYRFPKLAIVEIEDWVSGPNVLAVAVPSFVMVKQIAFTTDDAFNQAKAILPHEIAHQWWPATVFVNEKDLPFLAEGMCEYSSILYNESSGIKTIRDTLSHHPFLRPLINHLLKGKDVPLQQATDMRSLYTQYLKASYVHNMLRRIVGDSVFFRLYHEFAERYASRQASLEDFSRLADELSGKKLDWFFDQWVRKSGVPRLKMYNVRFAQNDSVWRTQGRVRVVGYDKYTVVADVGVETASGVNKTRVVIGGDSLGVYRNDVPFEVITQETPLRAMLDPDGDVLKIQKLPPKFSTLREPSDALFIIGTLQHAGHLLSLARNDSADLARRGWWVTMKDDTAITLAHLQREVVFLYGTSNENRVAAEQQAKFPMHMDRDSVTINGESISDSSLALLQVIENAFNAQGLMCWIAPFSDKAEPVLSPFDSSWLLLRGKDEIAKGTWLLRDEDVVVERR